MGYGLMVSRTFIAQHALIGGDFGAENERNSHRFRIEVELAGDRLDGHNYLVDITEVEALLDDFVADHRDRMLNDLPGFEATNPSVERFCRVAWDRFAPALAGRVAHLTVRIWEDEAAWAAYADVLGER